jgi:hypothetical protein
VRLGRALGPAALIWWRAAPLSRPLRPRFLPVLCRFRNSTGRESGERFAETGRQVAIAGMCPTREWHMPSGDRHSVLACTQGLAEVGVWRSGCGQVSCELWDVRWASGRARTAARRDRNPAADATTAHGCGTADCAAGTAHAAANASAASAAASIDAAAALAGWANGIPRASGTTCTAAAQVRGESRAIRPHCMLLFGQCAQKVPYISNRNFRLHTPHG